MSRLWFTLVWVAACASAPVVGIERVRAMPAGPAVLADAEARWTRFLSAVEPQFVAALALADRRANLPAVGVDHRSATRTPGGDGSYIASWHPDAKQFVIEWASSRTITVQWVQAQTSCGKHYGPSPAPCQPPIPTMARRTVAAEARLQLVYDRAGRFVSERSTGPTPLEPSPVVLLR